MMPALGFYGADKSLIMPHSLIRQLRRMVRGRQDMHCHANPGRTNDCGCRDMARYMSAFYGGALCYSKMNPGLMRTSRESARHVSSCNYDCCYGTLSAYRIRRPGSLFVCVCTTLGLLSMAMIVLRLCTSSIFLFLHSSRFCTGTRGCFVLAPPPPTRPNHLTSRQYCTLE